MGIMGASGHSAVVQPTKASVIASFHSSLREGAPASIPGWSDLWQIPPMTVSLTTPLLPAQYPVAAFCDASAMMGDAAGLRALADRLGYVYLPQLLPPEKVAALRSFVRDEAVACDWVLPESNNPVSICPCVGGLD